MVLVPWSRGARVTVGAGQVLVSEGEVGDTFYAVASGRLGGTQRGNGELGAELVLGEVHRGEYFGESAIPRGAPRMATVTATDVPCLPNEREHADMLHTVDHPELVRLVRSFDLDEWTLDQSRASSRTG